MTRVFRGLAHALLALAVSACSGGLGERPRIGVVLVFHGGNDVHDLASTWESTLQIFAYDPNSAVYRRVIWNPEAWPRILGAGNAPKESLKYAFEYQRIGGRDPANDLMRRRFEQLRAALEARAAAAGVDFIVDYASWLTTDPAHHAYPRLIYQPGVDGGSPMTYCGSAADGGTGPAQRWPGCDPQRYDTDGTIERLLAQGVQSIVIVDETTSGVRFSKSFDVVNLARLVVAEHNRRSGANVAVHWVNDPTDLMTESYPTAPPGWTLARGAPERDRRVPLTDRPNPVAVDPRLAAFHVAGIEARFSPRVPAERTGVLLVNHAIRRENVVFDPKIDDTLALNANIERLLLERHAGLKPEHVVGGWFGRKEINPELPKRPPAFSQLERTREMRGENLGDAWLYESDFAAPAGKWGYRYWEALKHLKDQGVEHIVVAFPQIMVDSVLNLVEVPNQIAKEIGYRTWAFIDAPDFRTYPGIGHPFADYWGIWVETSCPAGAEATERAPCCFELGGCADGRTYPPPRLAPRDRARDDLDPSLAFDVPAYGHLGYDPGRGPPDPNAPVQAQYRGTWALWQPPNDRPEVAEFLADKVLEFLAGPKPAPAAPVDLGFRLAPDA